MDDPTKDGQFSADATSQLWVKPNGVMPFLVSSHPIKKSRLPILFVLLHSLQIDPGLEKFSTEAT